LSSSEVTNLTGDRLGIKYYYYDGKDYRCGATLKSITPPNPKISNIGLNHYFYQGYIGGKYTIFENCYRERRNPVGKLRFDIPLAERLERVEPLLIDSIRKRADGNVGCFLSGGVD